MKMSMQVEVAFAQTNQVWIIPVTLPEFCSIEMAIQYSGILQQCPEIDLSRHKVGIFSKIRPLDYPVQPGDRIEIYRSLCIDPKRNRALRAQKQKQITNELTTRK